MKFPPITVVVYGLVFGLVAVWLSNNVTFIGNVTRKR